MITAAELLAASQPMRPKTAEESKRAVRALGLDEDQGKQCLRCFQFKAIDEFYAKGWEGETPLYNAWCKQCCRTRAAERKAMKNDQETSKES
jgi:hypothetical protein